MWGKFRRLLSVSSIIATVVCGYLYNEARLGLERVRDQMTEAREQYKEYSDRCNADPSDLGICQLVPMADDNVGLYTKLRTNYVEEAEWNLILAVGSIPAALIFYLITRFIVTGTLRRPFSEKPVRSKSLS